MQNIHRSDNSRVFCLSLRSQTHRNRFYYKSLYQLCVMKYLQVSWNFARFASQFVGFHDNSKHLPLTLILLQFLDNFVDQKYFFQHQKASRLKHRKKVPQTPTHQEYFFCGCLRNSNWRHSSFFPERILSARIYNRHMALCRAFTNFLCCLRFGRWIFLRACLDLFAIPLNSIFRILRVFVSFESQRIGLEMLLVAKAVHPTFGQKGGFFCRFLG